MPEKTFKHIALYRMRTFNDKFSDIFAWLREHWKPMLIFMTYFLLPLSIVNAFFMPDVISPSFDFDSGDIPMSFFTSVGFYILITMIAQIVCYSITYGMMRLYFFDPAALSSLSVRTFWPEMRHCMWRAIKISLFVGLVAIFVLALYIGLIALVGITLGFVAVFMVFLIPLLFVAAMPMMLIMPRTMFTDEGIISSFRNGYRLGWHTLGGVLAISIILYFITNIITGVCGIPVMIISFLKAFSNVGVSDIEFIHSPLFIFIEFLCNILYSFVIYCFSSVLHVGMAFQYGHAAEKIDSVTSAQNLESFETL